MNKLYSKIAALSVGLAMAIGVGVAVGSRKAVAVKADSVTTSWDASTEGFSNEESVAGRSFEFEDSNVTISFSEATGNGHKYYNTGTAVRSYGGNSFTIACSAGNLTSITLSNTQTKTVTADVGSVSGNDWTGSASSVTFTVASGSGNFRTSTVTAVYADGDTPLPTMYTITYDANGGTVSPASKQVVENGSLGELPTPTYDGYSFDGWQVDGAGDYVTSAYVVTGNVTLVAHWTEIPSPVGDEESFVFSELGYENAQEVTVVNGTKCNLTFDKGTNSNTPKYYTSGTAVRAYGGNTMTVSSSVNILKVVITFGGSDGTNAITTDVPTYTSGTWVGSAKEVVFTVGGTTGNRRIASVAVTVDSSTPVTVYTVTNNVAHGTLNKTQVTEGATLSATITPDTGYQLPDSVTVTMGGNPVTPSYENGVVTVENVQGDIVISGECPLLSATKIQDIYALATGVNVEFYGIFMGNKDNNNIILMDGEYGMAVYKNGIGTNEYVEKTTIIHVIGKTANFNGLVQVTPDSVEVVASADVATPVTYIAQGGETVEYCSRITTVSGVPSVSKGDFSNDPGIADITMQFAVGLNTVQVYYKKVTQTADTDAYEKIKACVEDGDEVTVKGFTAWYNGFQVQMTGLVEEAASYTAEMFAQDLMDQTDAICSSYDPLIDQNNKVALVAVWSDLASADKYPSLPAGEKSKLADADRKQDGTVIEQAMARYDYLTGKYDLNNFITGRTPMAFANVVSFTTNETENSSLIIVISAIAATSAIALGALILIKKRKHN